KTTMENQFKLTPQELEANISERTKAIIFCYPNNPTGGTMTAEEWKTLLPIIEKHDLLVISDEIYAELTYGRMHDSIAALPGMKERTILISGFSK
ncbi:aminotransferase class I/II-fold pyridoxal phosphate-dependent enzyme, partial [Mesorhizobium sp. M00.F.Ca.ET.186.01.1.1]